MPSQSAVRAMPHAARTVSFGCMSRLTPPTQKTGHRPARDEALKLRGSLSIRFDPAMTQKAAPNGKRGRQEERIARKHGGS